LRFQPKTEEEVQAAELCPEGKAGFTVLECSEGTSKKGDPMLKIKINVHAEDGFDYHVYDYISPAFMEYKFRHFFFSVGAGEDYEAGTVDPAGLVGREGWAEIIRQPGKGGYGPKAAVQDYLMENEKAKAKVAPDGATPAAEEDDNDVPF
jgi:hypothetical protein